MDSFLLEQGLKKFWAQTHPLFNEQLTRVVAASLAGLFGRGGISRISEITGLAHNTISSGIRELQIVENSSWLDPSLTPPWAIRRPGGGRNSLTASDPKLVEDLLELVKPVLRGDPMSPMCSIRTSVRKLADQLNKKGHKVSYSTVFRLLKIHGFSQQGNSKLLEGELVPDREEQMMFGSEITKIAEASGQLVESNDAKKKELIGNFKNNGKTWRPKNHPEAVNVYDYVSLAKGKASFYGTYFPKFNKGYMNIGKDHDTAKFAVNGIRNAWHKVGKFLCPDAKFVVIRCDCGGSNGYKNRQWKYELAKLSDEIGLDFIVSHLPPHNSKYNEIEHMMFSFVSINWAGIPLTSFDKALSYISSTTTKKGLHIEADIDDEKYPINIKINDKEFSSLAIEKASFHGEWNYWIHSNSKQRKPFFFKFPIVLEAPGINKNNIVNNGQKESLSVSTYEIPISEIHGKFITLRYNSDSTLTISGEVEGGHAVRVMYSDWTVQMVTTNKKGDFTLTSETKQCCPGPVLVTEIEASTARVLAESSEHSIDAEPTKKKVTKIKCGRGDTPRHRAKRDAAHVAMLLKRFATQSDVTVTFPDDSLTITAACQVGYYRITNNNTYTKPIGKKCSRFLVIKKLHKLFSGLKHLSHGLIRCRRSRLRLHQRIFKLVKSNNSKIKLSDQDIHVIR